MSASDLLSSTSRVARLAPLHRTIKHGQLWAFGLAQMDSCLSTLPFVALWALCGLLRARVMEGGSPWRE